MSNIKFGTRVCELHSGDVIYCNVETVKSLGYDKTLKLGEVISIHTNSQLGMYSVKNKTDLKAFVTIVIKNKIPIDKKWWQFWKKPQEEIEGYHLMIL